MLSARASAPNALTTAKPRSSPCTNSRVGGSIGTDDGGEGVKANGFFDTSMVVAKDRKSRECSERTLAVRLANAIVTHHCEIRQEGAYYLLVRGMAFAALLCGSAGTALLMLLARQPQAPEAGGSGRRIKVDTEA